MCTCNFLIQDKAHPKTAGNQIECEFPGFKEQENILKEHVEASTKVRNFRLMLLKIYINTN